MNKFSILLIFYAVSAIIIFLLEKFFPAPGSDGGWSIAALVIVLLTIVIAIWFVWSLVKGFTDKSYFIVALVHLIVLAVLAKKVFGIF